MTEPLRHRAAVLDELTTTIGEHFAGSDATPEQVAEAAMMALRDCAPEYTELCASLVPHNDVLSFELDIVNLDGHKRRDVFRFVPGPTAFLALLANNCEPGDTVTVTQRTAGGSSATLEGTFPITFKVASEMCEPMASRIRTLYESAPDGAVLRRWHRRFGRATVYTSKEVSPPIQRRPWVRLYVTLRDPSFPCVIVKAGWRWTAYAAGAGVHAHKDSNI